MNVAMLDKLTNEWVVSFIIPSHAREVEIELNDGSKILASSASDFGFALKDATNFDTLLDFSEVKQWRYI